MRVNYRPGRWNALIREDALLVLPATAEASLIADAWNGFDGLRELGAFVDLLTSRSGGSLASLPDFAAILVDGDDVRVAVRGVPEIVVETPQGQTRISGADVTTWNERFVRAAGRVDVVLEDADGVELPVIGGVVRAATVAIDPTAALASSRVEGASASASSAPVVAPVPSAGPEAAAPAVAEPVAAPAPVAAPLPPAPVGLPSVGAVPAVGAGAGAAGSAAAVGAVPIDEAPISEASAADEESGDDVGPDLSDTLLPEDDSTSDEIDEFEMLFGQTIHRPAADAAVPDDADAADAALSGDHDGATISLAEARALRSDAAPLSSEAPPVSPEAATVALPVVSGGGRIRVSTGQVVALDRTVIIGRRPRSTRASGANLPHLVAVESPQQDISRSHLEVRPEGDTVVVIDLHTTNGSTLLRSGSDPVRLHPGEQTIVLSGDVVDLGDGVTVAFEDLP